MKHLQGRALVTAMCIGQVGNLLPHVVVPAIMAQHLIPLWKLSATQAGLMASAYAVGYMLSVPVLTALTDRFDARGILFAGSLVSGLATIAFGLLADGLASAIIALGSRGRRFRRRLYAGPEGADGPAAARRRIAQRDALHVELLGRCRTVVPRLAACCRSPRMARGILGHRPRAAADDRGVLDARAVSADSTRAGIRSTFARSCATAPRSVTSSATARTASSSTACARGWCRSGPSSRPATRATCCLVRSHSASS